MWPFGNKDAILELQSQVDVIKNRLERRHNAVIDELVVYDNLIRKLSTKVAELEAELDSHVDEHMQSL